VLDGYTTPAGGLHVVYPSSRHLPPLVKAFIELAARRLSALGIGGSDDFVIV
jgi:DNA-binding transcriptional LysR family regulator